MASIKNLKKDVNRILAEVIEECYSYQLDADEKTNSKIEGIIDEAIDTFDQLIKKIHDKSVENKSTHFNDITKELETKGNELLDKLNKLVS
jgi:DNA anti-recombination protein RmuC